MTPEMVERIIARAIEIANSLIGTKEELGANRGKIVDAIESEFGLKGASWCVMFVLHCYMQACKEIGAKFPFYKTASSQDLFKWAKGKGVGYYEQSDIKAGDIIIWQHSDQWKGHAGLIITPYDIKTQRVDTIEGNTSSGEKGSQSNGDGVYKRSRNVSPTKFYGDFHLKGFINVRKLFLDTIA